MNTDLESVLIPLIPVLEQVLRDLKLKQQKREIEEKNETIFRAAEKEQRERLKAVVKAEQDRCPHIAGSNPLSEDRDHSGRTSIVWHITDTGETVGICTNCQREFWPADEDYRQWRKIPSLNKISAAGQRLKFVGNNAQQSVVPDEDDDKVATHTQDELYEILEAERGKQGKYAYPAEGLDALSDQDISKLFEGVKEYRAVLKEVNDTYSGPEWSVG